MTRLDAQAYCKCGHRAWQHAIAPQVGRGYCLTCDPHAPEACRRFDALEPQAPRPAFSRRDLSAVVGAIVLLDAIALYLAIEFHLSLVYVLVGLAVASLLNALIGWWLMRQFDE